MRRVFALVLKFKTNLLRKAFSKRDKTELHQQIGISSPSSANNKTVSKVEQNSKLCSLDPFIEEDQVLHVGGRLKNSSLNNSCTHPILLPKNGTVTELRIRWCHKKTAHGGRHITLSESHGYWIIDANSKTRQIIFKCVRCRSLCGRL